MLSLNKQQLKKLMPFRKCLRINFGEKLYNEKGECVLIDIEIIASHGEKILLTDYLLGPEVILHKRIITEMQKLSMKGVKYIPAKIRFRDWNCDFKPREDFQIITPPLFKVSKETILDDYFLVVAEEIQVVALRYGELWNGDNWVKPPKTLDKKALKKIPLDERLCFRLPGGQPWQRTLFHHSVKDIINALNPIKLYFYDIEGY
jgi:hypothetical protein